MGNWWPGGRTWPLNKFLEIIKMRFLRHWISCPLDSVSNADTTSYTLLLGLLHQWKRGAAPWRVVEEREHRVCVLGEMRKILFVCRFNKYTEAARTAVVADLNQNVFLPVHQCFMSTIYCTHKTFNFCMISCDDLKTMSFRQPDFHLWMYLLL